MTKREKVYAKFNGNCAYCGDPIRLNKHATGDNPVMQVEHVESLIRPEKISERDRKRISVEEYERRTAVPSKEEKARLNHIDNLLPSCPTCNGFKTMLSVEQFRERLAGQIDVELRNCNVFKRLLKYGQIEITSRPIIFEFEINI